MNSRNASGLVSRRGRFVMLTTFLAVAGAFAVVWAKGRRPAPEEILSRVELGSSLDALEPVRRDDRMHGGKVMRWIGPLRQEPDRSDLQLRVDGVTIRTEFGVFRQKDVGDFDLWRQGNADKSRFSGEVVMFTDWEAIWLTFLQGRLVKKDWGYLPS